MVLTFLSLFCGLHDDGRGITKERREKWGICMPATLCLESLHAKKPIALWELRRTFLHIFADTEHEKRENNEDENVVLLRIDGRGVGQPS